MSGSAVKKILVTGGNKGIGFAVCQKILSDYSDTHVLLGSRDASRGQAAVEKLKEELNASGRVDLISIDTSSDESVKAAAESIEGPLYGVVNNAATGGGASCKDTFDVNYWGVRRVCDAFVPKISKGSGRIVNVGSGGGPMYLEKLKDDDKVKQKLSSPNTVAGGVKELDDMANEFRVAEEGTSDFNAYSASKAFLAAYTYLLAKDNPDLFINVVSPGYIDTDLTRKHGLTPTKKPADGAVPILFCLLSPEVSDKPQGRYYGSDCKRSPLGAYRDPDSPEYNGPEGS